MLSKLIASKTSPKFEERTLKFKANLSNYYKTLFREMFFFRFIIRNCKILLYKHFQFLRVKPDLLSISQFLLYKSMAFVVIEESMLMKKINRCLTDINWCLTDIFKV